MKTKAKAAPLILIAPGTQRKGAEFFDYSITLSDAYPRAILAAGGIPWVMSCTASPSVIAQCVHRCDGVLLTGGDDIQPELYSPKLPPRLRKTVSPADRVRDLAEILLIREVFEQRKPLLAICRGQQILNVAFDGELIVDIPSQVPGAANHCRMDRKDRVVHQVELVKGSLLRQLLGKSACGVNSTHHQAVKQVVHPFRVAARSPDGIVEAMELDLAERHLLPYLLAVQFHPERLIERYPEFLELFRSFTRACGLGRRE
jgi:putative glutamine amidotransferase